MALLVVIVSVFCSTFLSWPIAIVLTILILLGHWGVQQLGDATAPGIGNLVGIGNPLVAQALSDQLTQAGATAGTQTTQILDLRVDRLHLNVLGLDVRLSPQTPLHLPITATVTFVRLIAGTPGQSPWHTLCELPLGPTSHFP